jgi:ParB/RepB/Spo0J family partition protein
LASLERLGDSIQSHGLLQPIIVRPVGDHYELVVGERRLRAAQLKGMDEIVARVEELDDTTCMELRLIENTHREDLTDAEKGDAIYALMAKYVERYPTIKSVADSIDTPYGTVLQWTSKSRKLSDHVRELLNATALVESQASNLMKYDHPTQDRLADAILRNALSSVVTPAFLRLYDSDPTADLDALANAVKGVKTVAIEVEKLSEEARREVEDLLEERAKATEEARERALERAWQAPRRPKPPPMDAAPVAVEAKAPLDAGLPAARPEAPIGPPTAQPGRGRGGEGLDVVPLWQAMETLQLPPEIQSALMTNIRNAEREYALGRVIKERAFNAWEIQTLIALAVDRPDLSVERLIEGVRLEDEKRRRNKFLTLEVGYRVWEALDAEAAKRRGSTSRLELMYVAVELLTERLKRLGHSLT